MRIRSMRKKDIGKAAKVFAEHSNDLGFAKKTALKYFKTSLNAKEKKRDFTLLKYWVAEENGQIIGVVGIWNLMAYPANTAWLGYFAVSKTFQGRNIGSKLYKTAETYARKRGVTIFCVDTSQEEWDAGSGAFYRGKGFTKVGKIPHFWGKGDHQIYLHKRLGK